MAHIPRFGDWENGDHVPYTVCFDNARADRGEGKKPFNPQGNPAAFSGGRGRGNDVNNTPPPASRPSNGFHSSERNVRPQGGRHHPTPSPTRSNNKSPAVKDVIPGNGKELPKFGAWDASSSDQYTFIFDQVRKEKQHANGGTPVHDERNHNSRHGDKTDEYPNPSCFGCLFGR